jgi:hypothetical protein
MNHDWNFAWVALVVGFVILRGFIGMVRARGKAAAAGQLDRMNAAARRILEQQNRSPVPVTEQKSGLGSAAKTRPRPARAAATLQPKSQAAAALPKSRTPAVVRTGILAAGKEPVIQRRR